MKNLLPWAYFWPLSAIFFLLAGIGMFNDAHSATQYSIVDTGQSSCYDNTIEVDCPVAGEAFYRQEVGKSAVARRWPPAAPRRTAGGHSSAAAARARPDQLGKP